MEGVHNEQHSPSADNDLAKGPIFESKPQSPSSTDNQPSIPDWPTETRTLSPFGSVSKICVDIASIILPISFIGLAISAAHFDQKPVSPHPGGRILIKATRLGPTIYPIIFAVIAGGCMKNLAVFKAERGIKLALLERLMGSQSLAGAFKMLYMLRTFSLSGIAIALLWCLSPLGGQAALRLMTIANVNSTTSIPLRYLDSIDLSYDSTLFFTGDSSRERPIINTLYGASILEPNSIQNSSMDLWGNVKIPSFEKLNSSNPDESGWVPIPESGVPYSSLIGLPVAGLPSVDKSSFAVESSYFVLDCPDISEPKELIHFQTSCAGSNSSCYIGTIGTTITSEAIISFGFGSNELGRNDTSTTPLRIVFSFGRGVGNGFTLANCTVTLSYVESRVNCEGKSCAVTEMRISRMNHTSPTSTPLDDPTVFENFATDFPSASGSNGGSGRSSLTEDFIANTTVGGGGGSALYALPRTLFISRLNQAFNTYWQPSLSFSPSSFSGNLPANLSVSNLFNSLDTTATVTTSQERYVCDHVWLSILLASASILLITGLVGAFLDYMSKSPDILGYMSTLTRDNPHITLPPGGSALDGDERARLLKDIRLTLADVDWNKDVGRIALSSSEDPQAKIAMAGKERPFS